jgi:hypothetical protein
VLAFHFSVVTGCGNADTVVMDAPILHEILRAFRRHVQIPVRR